MPRTAKTKATKRPLRNPTNSHRPDSHANVSSLSPSTQQMVNLVLDKLEKGVIPWRKPWAVSSIPFMPTRADLKPFSGFNLIFLMMAQYARGFDSAIWMTYEQAKEAGGQVIKGAKSEGAILYKTSVQNEGAEDEKVLKYLKSYRVFNVSEIEGLPDNYYQKPVPRRSATTDELHDFIRKVNPSVFIHGDMAYYDLEKDVIVMPPRDQFETELDFNMTLLHEISHFTLAPHRCDRKVDLKTHAGRAMEELVAEFTSVLLGVHLGFPVKEKTFDNHVAYLQSWVKNFRDRPEAFLKAAGKAQQAFDWLVAASTAQSSDAGPADIAPSVQAIAA